MNILLSAVGRRPYLVRWFQEALSANGVSGKVVAADHDPHSPAKSYADEFVVAPRVDDAGYSDWLAEVLETHQIDLAVSINDFELSVWATLPTAEEWRPLVRLTASTQHLIEDKSAMSTALTTAGVEIPPTWIANEFPHGHVRGDFVTKGRFGSGSRGLRFTNEVDLLETIDDAVREVTTRQGVPALAQDEAPPAELLVVQREIAGTEFGLDVVCDLDGRFQSVLAREKIGMRSGETDRAISTDPARFEEIALGIAKAVPHPGLVDVDVIVDPEGTPVVIDINPRFGGGYPFSHLAGAHVPSAYVAWRAGLPVNDSWLRSSAGIVSGKFVEVAAVTS